MYTLPSEMIYLFIDQKNREEPEPLFRWVEDEISKITNINSASTMVLKRSWAKRQALEHELQRQVAPAQELWCVLCGKEHPPTAQTLWKTRNFQKDLPRAQTSPSSSLLEFLDARCCHRHAAPS